MKMCWNNIKMYVNISSEHLFLGHLIHELSVEYKEPTLNIKNFFKKLKLRALLAILSNESTWQMSLLFKSKKKKRAITINSLQFFNDVSWHYRFKLCISHNPMFFLISVNLSSSLLWCSYQTWCYIEQYIVLWVAKLFFFFKDNDNKPISLCWKLLN